MNYRARFGWSNGPYSATLFYNYQSHFFETRTSSPPNVNFQCTASGGTIGGGTLPWAIMGYNDYQPPWNTFDLSVGYSTGTVPTNVYLQNLTFQLTVQNLMGIHPAFEYGPTSTIRNPAGYNIIAPDFGRVIGITLVKNW